MPISCIAHGCSNRYNKNRRDLGFKQIPTDEQLNKLWKTKIKRQVYPKDCNIYLCWEHFTDDCFERDLASEFKYKSTIQLFKIKNDAIPSKFSHIEEPTPRVLSKKRAAKQTTENMTGEICSPPVLASTSTAIQPFEEFTESFSNKEQCQLVDFGVNTDISIPPGSKVILSYEQKRYEVNLEHGNMTLEQIDVQQEEELINFEIEQGGTEQIDEEPFAVEHSNDEQCEEGGSPGDISVDDFNDTADTESEYQPSDESDSDVSDCEENGTQFPLQPSSEDDGGMKFITSFSSLLPLLKFCMICDLPAKIENIFTKGTALCVKLRCGAGHLSSWCSQPTVQGFYLGNILTSASVVFGGSTYSQFSSIADSLRLKIMSERSFYSIQKKFVYPTINYTYKIYQKLLIQQLKERESIDMSGDGRCDSPGYNAKYGTYSFMDQLTSKIVHFHVVTVGETTSSNAMELLGLKKVLEKLSSFQLNVSCLTTDDHPSIKNHLRETTYE